MAKKVTLPAEVIQKKEWIKEINAAVNYRQHHTTYQDRFDFRQRVTASWYPETVDTMTETVMVKKLKEKKEQLKEEIAYIFAFADYGKAIQKLHEAGKITVYCFGDRVCEDDKVKFVSSFLLKGIETSKQMNDLASRLNGEKLHCQITDRYAEKFMVYYSGYIEDENGKILDFKDIYNGFAVQLG